MDDQKILDTADQAHRDLTPAWRRAWDAWGAEVLTGAWGAGMVAAAVQLYPVVLG